MSKEIDRESGGPTVANENEIEDVVELEGLIDTGALSPGQWVIDADGDVLCLVDTHMGWPQKMWMLKAKTGLVGMCFSLDRAAYPVALANIEKDFVCKHNHRTNECGHCHICGRIIADPRPMYFDPEPHDSGESNPTPNNETKTAALAESTEEKN